MNIEVRLFATLRSYLPAGGNGRCTRVELPAGAGVEEVCARLGIPSGAAAIVLVDGRYEEDRRRPLPDGCVLSIFPPVAGG